MRRTARRKTTNRRNSRRKRKPPAARNGTALLSVGKALGEAFRTFDRARVAKLTDAQYRFIDTAGTEHLKSAVLRNLEKLVSGGSERAVKVRDYGRIATITGVRRSEGQPDVFTLDVWVKGKKGWRLLINHDNLLAGPEQAIAHAPSKPRPHDAPPPECKNPLQFVPYRPKSKAERDIIASFQQLEQAVTRNDADEWIKHMADEFVVTRTNQHPTSKAERAAFLRRQHAINAETFVAEVKRMKIWVHGNAAVMRADHVMPGARRPPYRATRIWIKRDGRWQMALSQQTTIAA
ncbi:MAG TPA: nuclear transport factor 2 family protein [Xanthobacteraceae bacterium]|nr:nuclear transport factor 2 family protein [Xanthobacteraceae bacterium]